MIIDLWSPLDYKQPMADPRRAQLAHSWMGDENLRRVTAYHLLDRYLVNAAREWLDADQRDTRREYGDAALMVERVVAAILGDTVTVAVEGADDDIPNTPDLPEPPDPPQDESDDISRRVYGLQQERWAAQVTAAVDEWEQAWKAQPGLVDMQDRLRAWADDELLEQQVWLGETDATGLGDGVYVLGWDTETRRPNLQVFDPRMYFPVLDDDAFRRGYPSRVHLAWEEERTAGVGANVTKQTWVRRITYELVMLDEPREVSWSDEPTWWTCTMSDAEWLIEDSVSGWVVDAVAPQKATYRTTPATPENPQGVEIRDMDLMIDFIPVVHVPGVPSGREHFGRSILARVLQLFDDLQASDSDLQAAAALAGTPMVGLSGEAEVPDDLVVAPGSVFKLGKDGRMDVVDLSGSVEALRHVISDLLERLSVNMQVPGEVVGRVDEVGAESGFARLLKLGPFSSLINTLRLVRLHKYRLLLKFVQRMYQAAGEWEPGPTVDARLVFGGFLPTDLQQVIEDVVALVQAKVLTVETGLRMLVEAGVPIDDITAEVDRLEAEDFTAAVALLDATGDEDAVRRRLRLPDDGGGTRPEPPPEIDLPPGGTPR